MGALLETSRHGDIYHDLARDQATILTDQKSRYYGLERSSLSGLQYQCGKHGEPQRRQRLINARAS